MPPPPPPSAASDNATAVIRLGPNQYIHVLDLNAIVTRVEIGPQTYVKKDHERIVNGPQQMIVVPPRHYVVIENPVVLDEDGAPVTDQYGQIKLRHADREIRMNRDPFPLYPGENLLGNVTPLVVVTKNSALRLRAVRDFTDVSGSKAVLRRAGDEWIFEGPATYVPQVEVEVLKTIDAVIIGHNQALRLKAFQDLVDRDGNNRVAGEQWLITKDGAYIPQAYELVVELVNAYVLTDSKALYLRALKSFKDTKGRERKNGEEWLVTIEDGETFIPSVYEEVVREVQITTLNLRQYTIVHDYVDPDTGKNQLGKRKLIRGEVSFFLKPGESMPSGIQNVYILQDDEALVLRSLEEFVDNFTVKINLASGKATSGSAVSVQRRPGDKWMIHGPAEFVPPIEVEVSAHRRAIPLDENEGVYIRDVSNGSVRAAIGKTTMLKENEELWEKHLPDDVEALLDLDPVADRNRHYHSEDSKKSHNKGGAKEAVAPSGRDRTRVVRYRVPHNAAVQIYDYRQKKARVVFGPDLVMLGPEEQFTLINLSGSKPKRPNVIRSLCMLLGPDFCTDIIVVETSDHARLSLQLSYNWHFDLDRNSPQHATKLFSVPDFIGDMCKALASRIRGACAASSFDDFHRYSAKLIRTAVFGIDETTKQVNNKLHFTANNLVVTSVDIQSVEPVDQRTRESLQKSVQLAIEITTASQEATARHEAERVEQEARGRLERQKIEDQSKAEAARKELLQLQVESAAVETVGQARAEAQARADSIAIEGQASVAQAELRSKAARIEAEAELDRLVRAREAELSYIKMQNELEVSKTRELAELEAKKFSSMINAIGPDTLVRMLSAPEELKIKLLQGLGLQSVLLTDAKSPINLFQTANGLIGGVAPVGALTGGSSS